MGSLEVIVGPPASGKTEALLATLRVAFRAGQSVLAVLADERRSAIEAELSPFLRGLPITYVSTYRNAQNAMLASHVVGIDDCERFDKDFLLFCDGLLKRGIRLVATSRDLDDRGNPLPIAGSLLAMADQVRKLQAICVECRKPARFARLGGGPGSRPVPVCADCFRDATNRQRVSAKEE